MPICATCEGFVTENYVHIFAPLDRDTVRRCPHCTDGIPGEVAVRDARLPRRD